MSLAAKHLVALGFWLLLMGAAYFWFDSRAQPKVAVAGNAGEIVIPRSPDAHFYVSGQINGQAVTFLVDTGASSVSVGTALARRLGLPRGEPITVNTANGRAQGEEIAGQTVTLGGMQVRQVRIVVLDGMSDRALLGQNVLRHLVVRQTAERMVIAPKGPDR